MAEKKPLRYKVNGDIACVLTNKDELFLISSSDVDLLSCSWSLSKAGYLYGGYPKRVLLHKLISKRMGFKPILESDHINRTPLDCRRTNLRPATSRLNKLNRLWSKANTSGVYGVRKHKVSGWIAAIGPIQKWFADINEAALYRQRLLEQEIAKEIEIAKKLNDPSLDLESQGTYTALTPADEAPLKTP